MVEINNTINENIDIKLVKAVVEEFLKHYKKSKFDVSIAFVSDKEIQELNKRYRKINKVTDVLSFEGEGCFLGEVVIDYKQIKRQAKKYGNSVKDELIFILVHGLLHLLGYSDENEEGREKMKRLGESFVKTLNTNF